MRTLALFLIGLIFGGGIGFTTATGLGVTFDGHDHGDPAHHGAEADHAAHDGTVEFGNASTPGLAFRVTEDPVSGYNLRLSSKGFKFAPENAGKTHVPGEGHAHIYVNGAKVARMYGSWFHLPSLPPGETDVTVTLNANDHRTLTFQGRPISLTQIVNVE